MNQQVSEQHRYIFNLILKFITGWIGQFMGDTKSTSHGTQKMRE